MSFAPAVFSRSAHRNPLYFSAFGQASQNEWKTQYCSDAALTLKRRRRALFNKLLRSEGGRERLMQRATVSSTYKSEAGFVAQQIGLDSDEEDCQRRQTEVKFQGKVRRKRKSVKATASSSPGTLVMTPYQRTNDNVGINEKFLAKQETGRVNLTNFLTETSCHARKQSKKELYDDEFDNLGGSRPYKQGISRKSAACDEENEDVCDGFTSVKICSTTSEDVRDAEQNRYSSEFGNWNSDPGSTLLRA